MKRLLTVVLLLPCVLVVVLPLVGVALAKRSTGSEDSQQVVVATQEGKISGFRDLSTKGNAFYSFHSIPYAKPPVGNLRLKDPVAAEGWTGVRNGTVVPPICSQIPFIAVTKREPVYNGEEDCLYLSTFSSKVRCKSKLPSLPGTAHDSRILGRHL
ncbi:Acetylcholinesterase-like 1 [Homarus americanus]|uniref:Acetylcholinesterase-like 1 n=1 Tax=Homarus americanus TaxID=6706 RepID=A0A8J5MS54_HOMAM|nr:Acetylcholinesterase-like 1 [Homarus americanus]